MRFLITGEQYRNPLIKAIILLFLVYIALFWLTNALMYFHKMGLTPASVIHYYLGSEEDFTEPVTYQGLLEVTHFHLFSMGILVLILTHLMLFVPLAMRAKIWLIVLTFFAAVANEAGGWLVRFVHPGFAYFKIGAFLLLETTLAALLILVSATLILGKRDTHRDPSLRTTYRGLISVLILIVLSGLPSVSRPASAQKRVTWYTGLTMGTHYSVKLTELPPEIDPQSLETEIARLLERVNSLLSTYQSDSEISRFNRNLSTDWVEISPELVMVLQEAQKLSQLTEGEFDVTIGPLVNLWGFGAEAYDQKVPSANQIQAAMEKVGYRQLHIRQSPPALKKARADIYIDLSALGEGYGIDCLAELLEAKGIHDYFVDIGGEQRIKGQSPHHTPWRIGIERPEPGESSLQRIIELATGAVATSGDYRTYFEQNGRRYSHIIDPRTGRPIDHTLASVTVIGQTAMHADALATALMVLGPEKGLELAEREQLAALLIMRRSENRFVEKATTAFAHRFIH